MPHIHPDVKADLERRIASLDTRIASREAMIAAWGSSQDADIKSHKFDSGDGKQELEKFDMMKIESELEKLYDKRSSLIRRLAEGQMITMHNNSWGPCG